MPTIWMSCEIRLKKWSMEAKDYYRKYFRNVESIMLESDHVYFDKPLLRSSGEPSPAPTALEYSDVQELRHKLEEAENLNLYLAQKSKGITPTSKELKLKVQDLNNSIFRKDNHIVYLERMLRKTETTDTLGLTAELRQKESELREKEAEIRSLQGMLRKTESSDKLGLMETLRRREAEIRSLQDLLREDDRKIRTLEHVIQRGGVQGSIH